MAGGDLAQLAFAQQAAKVAQPILARELFFERLTRLNHQLRAGELIAPFDE